MKEVFHQNHFICAIRFFITQDIEALGSEFLRDILHREFEDIDVCVRSSVERIGFKRLYLSQL